MLRKKVLVADDDEDVQSLIEMALAGLDVTIISLKSGTPVVESAVKELPELILLDIHLPGKSGAEIMKELRGNSRTRQIPVIILTGSILPDNVIPGFNKEMDEYFLKPFEIKHLMERINVKLDSGTAGSIERNGNV